MLIINDFTILYHDEQSVGVINHMKLKYTFESIDMGDEFVSVPVGKGADNVHGVLKLNKEGQEILDLLQTDTTEALIVDALAAKYDNDRKSLEDYVKGFIDALRANNLIEN